jgi:hypothetical protein
MPSADYCGKHPRERAGWTCQGCGRALCLKCAWRRRAGHGELVVCAHCGGFAQPILVPRIPETFPALILGSFVFPFSLTGFLTLFVWGLLFTITSYIGVAATGVAAVVFISHLLLVIRLTSVGEHDLPDVQDFSNILELLGALFRFVLVAAAASFPFLVYATYVKGATNPSAYFEDPVAYATLFIGFIWAPMACVLAATNSPITAVINPAVAIVYSTKIFGDYLLATLAFWLLGVGAVVIAAAGMFFTTTVEMPLLPRLYSNTVAVYLPLVMARILGLLLLTRGADLGYGSAREYFDPVLGDILPPYEPERTPTPTLPPEGIDDTYGVTNASADRKPASIAPNGIEPPPAEDFGLVPIAASSREGDLTATGDEEILTPTSVPPDTVSLPPEDGEMIIQHRLSSELEHITGRNGTVHGELELEADPSDGPAPELDGRPSDPTLTEPTFGNMTGPTPVVAAAEPAAEEELLELDNGPSDQQIRALADGHKYEELAAAYRARKGAITVLSAEELLQTAEAANGLSDLQTVSHALRRIGYDHPRSPLAPDALLNAGILLIRELGKPIDGERLLQRLLTTYPNSSAAQSARRLVEARN